ncbi:MAG: hypothetical protein IPH59_10405 [bacterium]|nr:hypothetical protein [bacterium]
MNKIICAIAFVLLAIYIPVFAQEDVTPQQSIPNQSRQQSRFQRRDKHRCHRYTG